MKMYLGTYADIEVAKRIIAKQEIAPTAYPTDLNLLGADEIEKLICAASFGDTFAIFFAKDTSKAKKMAKEMNLKNFAIVSGINFAGKDF